MAQRSRRARGITLVEAALILCLLGIVLAVGLPAFVRGVRTSKTAEPVEELERMFAAATAYYASAQPTATGKRIRCLPEPAGPWPAQPSPEPVTADFGAADAPGSGTWRAIGYEPAGAIRFRYSLLPQLAPGCGTHPADTHGQIVLTLRAEGDLDADGMLSRYERNASVRGGELVLEPLLVVHDRVE